MSTTATIEIGSDRWNAQVYASLSKASELAAELDRPGSFPVSTAYNERALDLLGELNEFLTKVLAVIDKSESLKPSPLISKEKYLSARDSTLKLYEICQRLLSLQGEIGGLGEQQSKLELLQSRSESLLDVADWLDAMSSPEEIGAKFDAALADLAKGDVIPWAEVK